MQPTIAQWRKVFFIAAFVYIICATVFNILGSGARQPWDDSGDSEADEKPTSEYIESDDRKVRKDHMKEGTTI